MRLSARLKRVAISVMLGLSLVAAASAPAFAQHRDRHNHNNRRGGIFGTIFGGNNHRHRNSNIFRRRGDRHDRWGDSHGRGHRKNRGRGHDRHRSNRYYSRW